MKKWPWMLAILVIAGGGVAYTMTRGLRNKNPGNIRYSPANNWVGQVGKDDGGYAIFSDAKYGIRAIGKVLDSYRRRGLVTVEQIISTYAPPEDQNHTAAYIRNVKAWADWPDGFHPVRQEGDYLPLVKAIIRQENGVNPYSDAFISDALALS